MAIDGIGALSLNIADREAAQIEDSANIAGIPTGALQGVGSIANKATDSFENILRLEADTAAKKAEKELLASGMEGVTAYATDQGLDPSKYQRMGAHVQDERGFMNLYDMIKREKTSLDDKAKQKAVAFKSHEVLSEAERLIADMNAPESTSTPKEVQAKLTQLMSDPDLSVETSRTINSLADNMKSERSARALSKGKLVDFNGRLLPSRESDEKSLKATEKQMSFGDRGGQKVLGTAILKQIAIQDGLDTIEGVIQKDIKGTNQIGRELASIIASVLAGAGQATEGSIENLFPSSWEGSLKDAWGQVTGKPQDAMPEDMLEQLRLMLDREAGFWNQRISEMNAELAIQLDPVFSRTAAIEGKPVRLNEDLRKSFLTFLGMIEERGNIGSRLTGSFSERGLVENSDAHKGIIEMIKGDDISREFRGEAPITPAKPNRSSTRQPSRSPTPVATQSVESPTPVGTEGDMSDEDLAKALMGLGRGR